MDVLPDVELGPVGERKDADALALVLARVVEAPELRALLLRVPAVLRRAEREDALLGARLLLVAARAAERRVEAVLVERLLQALRLPDVGVDRGAVRERIDALRERLRVDVDDELEAELLASSCRETSIISRNFHVVSTCSSGNGGFDGWNAFIARCSITELSLPIE